MTDLVRRQHEHQSDNRTDGRSGLEFYVRDNRTDYEQDFPCRQHGRTEQCLLCLCLEFDGSLRCALASVAYRSEGRKPKAPTGAGATDKVQSSHYRILRGISTQGECVRCSRFPVLWPCSQVRRLLHGGCHGRVCWEVGR